MAQNLMKPLTGNSLYLTLTASIVLCSGTTFSSELPEAKTLVKQKIVTLSQNELHSNSKEVEEKLIQAARQGFFYLEIPEELTDQVDDVVKFANEIYKDENLKGKKFTGVSGYHELGQVEAFFSEQTHWKLMYPKFVQDYAMSLQDLSIKIMHKIFPLVLPQLKKEVWNKATGNLFDNTGVYGFSFNHYRPENNAPIGYPPHCDVGYITILLINKKGLYAQIDNEWQAILPKPGHFVINFGKAFELLVNDSSKLSASWHVVKKLTEKDGDRISFGLFTNPSWKSSVMKATEDGMLEEVYPSYQEFCTATIQKAKDNVIDVPNFEDEK